jgi:DnaA family protein
VSHQLPLNIQLRDDAIFDSFYPADNQEALDSVMHLIEADEESFVYVWGQTGVGRSHLLQAACHDAGNRGFSATYFSLKNLVESSIDRLDSMEHLSLICLDDIEGIAGNADWEEAVFHLFNRIRALNTKLLVSAMVAPKDLNIVLPDLKSRLSWGITYQLHRLDDQQKLKALQLRAKLRGLALPESVGQFLLSRCIRSTTELFSMLEILDKASLAEQRRLTVPFVKQVLML